MYTPTCPMYPLRAANPSVDTLFDVDSIRANTEGVGLGASDPADTKIRGLADPIRDVLWYNDKLEGVRKYPGGYDRWLDVYLNN
jgi:hypothetical protein